MHTDDRQLQNNLVETYPIKHWVNPFYLQTVKSCIRHVALCRLTLFVSANFFRLSQINRRDSTASFLCSLSSAQPFTLAIFYNKKSDNQSLSALALILWVADPPSLSAHTPPLSVCGEPQIATTNHKRNASNYKRATANNRRDATNRRRETTNHRRDHGEIAQTAEDIKSIIKEIQPIANCRRDMAIHILVNYFQVQPSYLRNGMLVCMYRYLSIVIIYASYLNALPKYAHPDKQLANLSCYNTCILPV